MLSLYDERLKNAIKQYELTEDHLYGKKGELIIMSYHL